MRKEKDFINYDLKETFNILTIKNLLYGTSASRSANTLNKLHIFLDYNPKIAKDTEYKVSSTRDFFRVHLGFTSDEDDRSFQDYLYVKKKNSGANKSLKERFLDIWKDKSINELYELNKRAITHWTSCDFPQKIALLLPDTDDLNTYCDKTALNLYADLLNRKNYIKKMNWSVQIFSYLQILSYVNTHEEASIQNNAFVLTWISLIAFLQDDIQRLPIALEDLNKYKEHIRPEAFNIPHNHFSLHADTPSNNTNAIFVSTKTLYHDYHWTTMAIAQNLVSNDEVLYNTPPGDPSEGTAELWASFIEAFPLTFGFLFAENQIIGNYSFCGLRKEIIPTIESGKFFEGQLSIDNEYLVSLNIPGRYILSILNISCNLQWSSPSNNQSLICELLEQIKSYASHGIFFDGIYTTVFRPEQELLYRELGFKRIGENIDIGQARIGQIYYLASFNDLNFNYPITNEIKKLYI